MFLILRPILIFISLTIAIINSTLVSAKSGVGISTGKIIIDSPLKTLTLYSLPSITVYNTGDELTRYEMEVTFNEYQSQRKPESFWISFSPKQFALNPGESRQVSTSIYLPEIVLPGRYHAYLEAHTISAESSTIGQNKTNISTASAVKFYFSVINSTIEDNSQSDNITGVSELLSINKLHFNNRALESIMNKLIYQP